MSTTSNGILVKIPYTVANSTVTLPAYSKTFTIASSSTQDGESGIVATFAWPEQSNLAVGSGTFNAYITIDDSASTGGTPNDNVYNAKKLDIDDDIAGLVAATFNYPIDDVGGTGTMTLKIIPGIRDRKFGVVDFDGDENHNFLYLPVTNPTTGKTWLNNNLGAAYASVDKPTDYGTGCASDVIQQATSSDDHCAYGSLFQWGRKADGHELIKYSSGSAGAGINGVSSTNADEPTDSKFIKEGSSPYDWRVDQDDALWSGESAANAVCPTGYRLPLNAEFITEYDSWENPNVAGALSSKLKLPIPGDRSYGNATIYSEGSNGYYWSSSVSGTKSRYLYLRPSNDADTYSTPRSGGFSVRCIKNEIPAATYSTQLTPTVADYAAAGVTGVDATNLNAVNAGVYATDAAGVDTVAKIQAIADTFTVNTYTPLDEASDVDGDTPNISAVFTENITAQSGKNIEIWQDRATDIRQARHGVTSLNVAVSGATLDAITIPSGHLAYGKDYYIKIDAGAFKNDDNEDYAGITDTTTWNFSTSATSGPCECPDFDNCDLPANLQ
jgi:uncharacterized protein (TIGR02145 family)